jgi:hypothetical protein
VALARHLSHGLDYHYGVERARGTWTDERLDDLARRMDDGFNRVDAELRALRAEVRAEMRAEIGGVNARLDALQRTMIQVAAAIMATFVAGFLGLIATQL